MFLSQSLNYHLTIGRILDHIHYDLEDVWEQLFEEFLDVLSFHFIFLINLD